LLSEGRFPVDWAASLQEKPILLDGLSTTTGATQMSKVQQRKKYDSVELKPLATSTDNDDDEEEYKTKSEQWLNWALYKLHALLWIIIASALAIYTQLFEVIVNGHPPVDPKRQLNR
jgi:hypothetical protein